MSRVVHTNGAGLEVESGEDVLIAGDEHLLGVGVNVREDRLANVLLTPFFRKRNYTNEKRERERAELNLPVVRAHLVFEKSAHMTD